MKYIKWHWNLKQGNINSVVMKLQFLVLFMRPADYGGACFARVADLRASGARLDK
jgi:hypothetical protein